ncbi:DUF6879 family protein [Streptomyces sp. LHD-70]|uniref:DUF6879 family protein n=1 Tax=Streptomyces sp. LHD-70 TaxID=3072140 RepID=UPI0035BE8A6D
MRDSYMASDPAYQAWCRGERDRPADTDPGQRPWLQLMQDTTARGVEIRRARVVSVPESDYIRFEHHLSDANVKAGEQIRWLPRRQASQLALPGNDFWLFDHSLVVFLHFAGDGELAPHDDEERTTDAKVVQMCSTAFEAVWDIAVPHQDYQLS